MKKFLIVVVCLAVYLNIGWALGTYYHNNILTKKSSELTTFTQKALAGAFLGEEYTFFWTKDLGNTKKDLLLRDQVCVSILWPLPVLCALILWVAKGIWIFVFTGGIAKLFGVG